MLRKLWNRIGRRAATTGARAPADYRRRLTHEPLEQRTLLSVAALFGVTIDNNQMELDNDDEFRLFIYGDENNDTITIAVDGSDNVTVNGSDQINTAWNEGSNSPSTLTTVAASSVKAITVDAGDGVNTIDLSAVTSTKFTSLVDRQIILSGGSGVDTITGSSFGDIIGGLGGNDTITGGPGDDLIHGGDGVDTINGGAGNDVISGGHGADVITDTVGLNVIEGNGFKDAQEQGSLDNGDLDEPSGMAIGRANSGIIWTIEDRDTGGGNVRLYANELDGDDRGYYSFTSNVVNQDWEDLAFDDDGTTKWIYIVDIGDNNNNDAIQTIYRTAEPTNVPMNTENHATIADSAIYRIRFEYPDQQGRDAETLMVDQTNGDIYIVTKRERATPFKARLYRIAGSALTDGNDGDDWKAVSDANDPNVVRLTDLGEISVPVTAISSENSRFAFSGGDISTDGLDVLLRTDRSIFLYHRDSTAVSIDDLLTTVYEPEQMIAAYERGNRESIAFNDAGDKFYTVSEWDSNDTSNVDPNRFGVDAIAQQVHLYEAASGADTITYNLADLTKNGAVDFQDLTILLANWNQDVSAALGNLVDPGSSVVEFADLTVLLAAWTGPHAGGSPCAPTASIADGDTITSSSVDIDFTFENAVTGVDASDLELRGIGGVDASVGTPTNTEGNVWRFPVSGLKIGPVVLVIAPDSGDILDPAGDYIQPMAIDFIAMPGVSLTAGALEIDGSSTDDTIIIAADGSGKLTLSGATVDLGSGDINASAVTSIDVDGLAGNDTLDLGGVTSAAFTGLTGSVTVIGGGGSDTYVFSGTNDLGTVTITEAANLDSDTLDFSGLASATVNLTTTTNQTVLANVLVLNLSDGEGLENVIGTPGVDNFTGNSRNNRITGGAGNDTLAGGTGNNTYVFSGSSDLGADTITEAANAYFDTLDFTNFTAGGILLDISDDTLQVLVANMLSINLSSTTGIERVNGTALADNITGNSRDNTINGGAGGDTLYGLGGSDWLNGDAGADAIYGGNDGDTLYGGDGNDTIYGDAGADYISGDADDDNLYGGDGNDSLAGGTGNDFLHGEAGDDSLDGGADNDVYHFEGSANLGTDTIYEAANADTDTLDFASFTAGGITVDISDDTLQVLVAAMLSLNLSTTTGIENVNGTSSADDITGNTRDNMFYGGSGDDILNGGSGADTLYGDAGNDTMNGGSGDDLMYGGADDDYMNGGTDDDLIYGEDGDDDLWGGGGTDTLDGGNGCDSFEGVNECA